MLSWQSWTSLTLTRRSDCTLTNAETKSLLGLMARTTFCARLHLEVQALHSYGVEQIAASLSQRCSVGGPRGVDVLLNRQEWEAEVHVYVKPQEEEKETEVYESGMRKNSGKQVTHPAVPGEKKTICGWIFRRDSGWSVSRGHDDVTCGKC